MDYRGPIERHMLAAGVFVVAATLFLWNVLFLDYSLGAFDVILNQPSWKGEFASGGVHQPILSDSPTAHYPQREFDWGQLRSLSGGWFNPYIFTGMPWSPQGVGAFVTSVPQLFLSVANAVDWSTWLRLVLAGLFMYLFVLELGLNRAAGIFAGIMWTYSLHQVVWLEYPQHLATQLWIPLLFLLNYRMMNKGMDALTGVSLLVVNILFFTSGYTQIVLYTYVAVGLFNSFFVAAHIGERPLGAGLRRWAGVHAIYIAAVLVCATGVVAEMSLIGEGLRGAQEWRGRVDAPAPSFDTLAGLLGSFVPRLSELTHVLAPDYYGGIWEGRYRFEHGNIVETARYFGVLGLVFAVTALFTAWGSRHLRPLAAFIALTALMFSLFYRDEVTMGLFRLIPLADKGSYSRFITPLTFLGCTLAAYGFHHALGARHRWLFASMAVLVVLVLVAWWAEDGFAIARMWYPAMLIGGLAAAVAVRNVLGVDWKWVGPLVVVITAADLFAAGYGFNTRMENDRLFPRNNTIRFLLNDPEPYRVAVISDQPLYHPNILSFYDIPVVEGYSTVVPLDYARYVGELMPENRLTRNGILFLFEPNVAALRLLNVKYILSDQDLGTDYPGLEHVLDSNNHSVYRIKDHLPRLFCASDVFHARGRAQALQAYGERLGGFETPVVLRGKGKRQSYSGECRIGQLEVYTHRVTATVRSERPRYVVIPYAYSDNWRMTINGEAQELARANGYHMAVQVPAGTSNIELLYRDRMQQLAALVFILAALGVAVYVWRARRPGPAARGLLAGVAVTMIFKASVSLPLFRNDSVPERMPVVEKYEVFAAGARRLERIHHSDRVVKGDPVQYPLEVDSKGLTRLSLLAGTFRQARLQQDVTVELLGAGGEILVKRTVPGPDILNNSWFSVDFPAIEAETALSVRVSSEAPELSKSFILWLDSNRRVCVQSFYRQEPGSEAKP